MTHKTIASAANKPKVTTPIEPATLSPADLLALVLAAAATVDARVVGLAAAPLTAPPLADCEPLELTGILEVVVILVLILVIVLVLIMEVFPELLLFPRDEAFAAPMVGEAARLTLEPPMVE